MREKKIKVNYIQPCNTRPSRFSPVRNNKEKVVSCDSQIIAILKIQKMFDLQTLQFFSVVTFTSTRLTNNTKNKREFFKIRIKGELPWRVMEYTHSLSHAIPAWLLMLCKWKW